jgi:hypothetical protein
LRSFGLWQKRDQGSNFKPRDHLLLFDANDIENLETSNFPDWAYDVAGVILQGKLGCLL